MELVSRVRRLVTRGTAPDERAAPEGIGSATAAPLRVGLAGASNISKFAMINAASRRSDVEVRAVATRTAGKARAFAKAQGIPVAHESFEALFADPSIDAVYISVVTEEHLNIGLKALRAGKHVLLEKPLATTAEEARDLRDAAETHGVVLMEALHYKHHPALKRLRDLVETREVGDVENIDVVFAKFDPVCWGIGGSYSPEKLRVKMLDRWIYCVDVIQLLAPGRRVAAVRHATDAGFVVRGELDLCDENDDSRGRVRATWEADAQTVRILPAWVVTVQCTRGSLVLQNFNFPSLYHRLHIQPADGPARTETHYGNEGRTTFEYQLDAFCRAVRSRRVDPLVPPESSVATLEIVDRIRAMF